jgi:hypothetical protein
MIAMYLLRKWYVDLLTHDGMYLFLYYAFIRIAGVITRSLVLHIAPAGADDAVSIPLGADSHIEDASGGREIRVGLKAGGILIGRNGCRITARDPRATVDLVYSPLTSAAASPVIIAGTNGGHIRWEPIGVRYRVSGTVTMNGSRFDVEECPGYADFLESTILPLRVPVRKLIWGRGHFPTADLTFMHASGGSGTPSWSRLIVYRGEKVEESDMVEITGASGLPADSSTNTLGSYLLRATLPREEFAMTVSHRKAVQRGSFIDQQKIRWQPARSFIKRVTRDPRGTKYLSSAEIPAWGRNATGLFMIDEEACL